MSSKKRLIINADDFGLLPEVNRGVIECFEKGSISSTTMMVNTEGTEEAASLAKKHLELGVGLHFNLTLGRPVSSPFEIPSLVGNNGGFNSRSTFEKKMLLKKIQFQDVEKEFKAQMKKFEEFELEMTHIDSHHHVHLFPSIFKIVSYYAKKKGFPLRIPWVFYKFLKPALTLNCMKTIWRKFLLNIFISKIPAESYEQIMVPNRFLSVYDFVPMPRQFFPHHYLRLIKEATSGLTEIMVHPAYNTPKLEILFSNSYIKELELKTLTNFSLIKSAEKMGIEIVSFKEYLGG